jgi:hypothetical protein
MYKILSVLFVLAIVASATPITLIPVTTSHEYQQTTNNPCIIGDPSCQNGSFAETVFPPGANSYDSLSPVYTVANIRSIIGGNTFLVGLDINQTEVVQTLSLFTMMVNGSDVATYSASPATAVPPTSGGGNGNGYADYVLSGFNLSSYSATDTVQFHVVMPLVNDGREEYFLISSGTPGTTPEPATFALLGAGLLGFTFLRRK